MALLVALLPVAAALFLFFLVVVWSAFSLWRTSKFGGALAVIIHVLLGAAVVAVTIATINNPHFISWSSGCKGHIFGCYQEASFVIASTGLLPCGFPITGHILELVWRRKKQ